jgi:hypothetical protein
MAGLGTGGDDDLLGLDDFFADLDLPATVVPCADEGAVAVEQRDLVLLEQALDAAGELGDDGVLARDHRRHVDLRRADRDALCGEAVAGFLEQVRGMQQRLGRNAADVQAGAAEARLALGIGIGIRFAAGDLETELRGADGGNSRRDRHR